MKLIFTNVIASGPVDWKAPLTAPHQPSIRECFLIVQDEGGTVEIPEATPTALGQYATYLAKGYVVIGHSVEFHAGALRAAMIPWGIDPCDGRAQTICTMLSLTGRVPKRNGKKGWPTFDEACDFFGITRAGTESAEDNARCLALVFKGMEAIGAVPEPKIWKERHG
jgi:hypothetical protein